MPTLDDALAGVRDLMTKVEAGEMTYAEYEKEAPERLSRVGRAMDTAALARQDVDAPAVWIDGKRHRRVHRCEAEYIGVFGRVRVERSLYRADARSRAVVPMELRAGIVEQLWTPSAAGLAMWAVAHLTPAEAADLFARSGGMAPSRATLDRLPKALGEGWEAQRTRFEESLRVEPTVPDNAVSVVVSLDGILVPMKDGNRQQKRAAARRTGKETRGPAGFREASCGTLWFVDADGDRVGDTVYLGRMPERNKRTLKEMLEDELLHVLDQRPALRVVAVADGARDNWRWLERAMPDGCVFVLDFFHAAEHLKRAMDAAHGKDTPRARAEFARLRLILRDGADGVGKIINAIAYQCRKHPRRKALKRELGYFRGNRTKMAYARVQADHLPIGSGVVEAANKTLVTVRMKRAGARWSLEGGQGVLTFRALAKSSRYDRAWEVVAGTYVQSVSLTPPAAPPPANNPSFRAAA